MSKKIIQSPDEDQIAIVDMLKEALAQAIEGKFNTCAVVVVMEDGYASAMGGRDAGSLMLATHDLQENIMSAVRRGTQEKQSRRSSILRVQ